MSPEVAARRWRLAVRLTAAASIWSLGLLLAALFAPVDNSHTVTNASGLTVSTETLVGEHGAWVLVPVAAPSIVCGVVGVALWMRRGGAGRLATTVARVGAGVLIIFALVGILSVGILLVPAAILLACAVALTPEPHGVARPERPEPVVAAFERL